MCTFNMADNPDSTSVGRPKINRTRFSSSGGQIASNRSPTSDSESSEDGERRSSRTKQPRLVRRDRSSLNDGNGGGAAVTRSTRKRPATPALNDEYTTTKIAKRELGEESKSSSVYIIII